MDWCVQFPKEPVLMLRPSLRKACGDNRKAAMFLSYLLYHASSQKAAEDGSITIYRTQKQVVQDMDGEISDRTLRDEAVPCLIDLGYLVTKEHKGNKQYTEYQLFPKAIQAGIKGKVPHYKTLPYYKDKADRKNFRAENIPNGSEIFPSGSENSPNGLSVGSGNSSEPESGDKSAQEAGSSDVSDAAKNKEDITNKINIKTGESSPLENQSSNKMGHARIAMKKPLRLFGGNGIPDSVHEQRAHDILQRLEIPVPVFRQKVEAATEKTKAMNGDIEYFFKELEQSCPKKVAVS